MLFRSSITSDVAWWFNLNIYYDKDSIVAYGYMMHPSDADDDLSLHSGYERSLPADT